MNKISPKTASAGTKPAPSTSSSSSSSSSTSHQPAPSTYSSSSSSLTSHWSAPSTYFSSISSLTYHWLAPSSYSSSATYLSSLADHQPTPSTYSSSSSSLNYHRPAPSTYSSFATYLSSLASHRSTPSTYSSSSSTYHRPPPATHSSVVTYLSSLAHHQPAPSTHSSSSSTQKWKYDVFLCFCGRDTRYEFTDALFHGLRVRGIIVFRDNEGLQRGEKINPALEAAIKESRNAIVIVSPNFTKSKACSFELTKIMECRRKGRLDVFPVFYHTDPADVPSMDPQLDQDPVESSRKALKELSNISTWVIRNESYTALLIDKICREILFKRKEAYQIGRSSRDVASVYEAKIPYQNHNLFW